MVLSGLWGAGGASRGGGFPPSRSGAEGARIALPPQRGGRAIPKCASLYPSTDRGNHSEPPSVVSRHPTGADAGGGSTDSTAARSRSESKTKYISRVCGSRRRVSTAPPTMYTARFLAFLFARDSASWISRIFFRRVSILVFIFSAILASKDS